MMLIIFLAASIRSLNIKTEKYKNQILQMTLYFVQLKMHNSKQLLKYNWDPLYENIENCSTWQLCWYELR